MGKTTKKRTAMGRDAQPRARVHRDVQCPDCLDYRQGVKPERSEDGAWHFVCRCGYRWAGYEDGAPIGYGGVNPAWREGEG